MADVDASLLIHRMKKKKRKKTRMAGSSWIFQATRVRRRGKQRKRSLPWDAGNADLCVNPRQGSRYFSIKVNYRCVRNWLRLCLKTIVKGRAALSSGARNDSAEFDYEQREGDCVMGARNGVTMKRKIRN